MPLFRNPAFVAPLKTALAHPDSPFLRQSVTEVLGRALPRLVKVFELPNVTSGTFPSVVDALVRG